MAAGLQAEVTAAEASERDQRAQQPGRQRATDDHHQLAFDTDGPDATNIKLLTAELQQLAHRTDSLQQRLGQASFHGRASCGLQALSAHCSGGTQRATAPSWAPAAEAQREAGQPDAPIRPTRKECVKESEAPVLLTEGRTGACMRAGRKPCSRKTRVLKEGKAPLLAKHAFKQRSAGGMLIIELDARDRRRLVLDGVFAPSAATTRPHRPDGEGSGAAAFACVSRGSTTPLASVSSCDTSRAVSASTQDGMSEEPAIGEEVPACVSASAVVDVMRSRRRRHGLSACVLAWAQYGRVRARDKARLLAVARRALQRHDCMLRRILRQTFDDWLCLCVCPRGSAPAGMHVREAREGGEERRAEKGGSHMHSEGTASVALSGAWGREECVGSFEDSWRSDCVNVVVEGNGAERQMAGRVNAVDQSEGSWRSDCVNVVADGDGSWAGGALGKVGAAEEEWMAFKGSCEQTLHGAESSGRRRDDENADTATPFWSISHGSSTASATSCDTPLLCENDMGINSPAAASSHAMLQGLAERRAGACGDATARDPSACGLVCGGGPLVMQPDHGLPPGSSCRTSVGEPAETNECEIQEAHEAQRSLTPPESPPLTPRELLRSTLRNAPHETPPSLFAIAEQDMPQTHDREVLKGGALGQGSHAGRCGENDGGGFSGWGEHTFKGGTVYHGEFKNGSMCGHGLLLYVDGRRFEGHFRGR